MEMKRFLIKTLNDFRKIYQNVEATENILKITQGSVEVQVLLIEMHNHCLEIGDYKKFIGEYRNCIDNLLKQNVYKVNYDMVFPVVRKKDEFEDALFFSMPLFEDLSMYFVEDMGELFRFIAKNDKVDFNILYDKSFENLNKLVNPLNKLHEGLDIYCLRYSSDLVSSMFLNKSTERNIIKLFGLSHIFTIPAASTLLVAANTKENVSILKELVKTEDDPNRISDKIIEFNKGVYRYVGL